MTTEADTTKANGRGQGAEMRPEVFDSFDEFLKQAIRDYYDRGWKSRRGNVIALMIASGQMTSMAADSLKDGSGLRKAALGVAGVAALRLGLKYFLSGPLGVLLTGAAAVSAVGYVAKHQKEISTKRGVYAKLIADTREKFDEIQGGYRAGRYDSPGRNLMVDGLLKRFLEQIDVEA